MPYMYLPRPFLLCMPYVSADEEHTSSITGESWRRFTIAGSGWNFRRNSSSAMEPAKLSLLAQTLHCAITCDPTTLTHTDILTHLRRLTGYESFTFGTTVSTFRNGMRCHQQLQMSHPQRKQASLLIHRPSSNTRLTVLSRLWLALYTS